MTRVAERSRDELAVDRAVIEQLWASFAKLGELEQLVIDISNEVRGVTADAVYRRLSVAAVRYISAPRGDQRSHSHATYEIHEVTELWVSSSPWWCRTVIERPPKASDGSGLRRSRISPNFARLLVPAMPATEGERGGRWAGNRRRAQSVR